MTGAFGGLQLTPASIVQFRCVALHPAPNGGVVSRETSFQEQFLDVPIRKREPQIPTDRANNDLGFEVPPFEQRWPRFDHGTYCSLSDSFIEFLQHSPLNYYNRACAFAEESDKSKALANLDLAFQRKSNVL